MCQVFTSKLIARKLINLIILFSGKSPVFSLDLMIFSWFFFPFSLIHFHIGIFSFGRFLKYHQQSRLPNSLAHRIVHTGLSAEINETYSHWANKIECYIHIGPTPFSFEQNFFRFALNICRKKSAWDKWVASFLWSELQHKSKPIFIPSII